MGKWKKLLIPLGIAVVLIGGGLAMFNPFTGKDDPRYKVEQDRMVKYLAQNYESIKKVEFTSFSQNTVTGTWSCNAIVNDGIYVTFSLNSLGNSEKIGFGQHISQSKGLKLTKRNSSSPQSEDSISVIYWEEE